MRYSQAATAVCYRREGCTTKAMDSAAGKGRMETVQWLHNNRQEGCTSTAIVDEARNGHLEMLKWLHVNQPNISSECRTNENHNSRIAQSLMNGAAANGHLEVVQRLHGKRFLQHALSEH